MLPNLENYAISFFTKAGEMCKYLDDLIVA